MCDIYIPAKYRRNITKCTKLSNRDFIMVEKRSGYPSVYVKYPAKI